MRVNIDFSQRRRGPGAFALVLLISALVITADAVWQFSQSIQQHRQLQASIAGVRLKAKQPRAVLSAKQVEAINRAVLQLNMPWERLLSAVETRLSDSIALLGLEPDAGVQVLRIQAEARTADDMLEFVYQLAHEDMFATVHLVRHEVNQSDVNKPFGFTVEAQWQVRP